MTRLCLLLTLAAVVFTGPALALDLSQCTRTTHISHGGQADHVDLGDGRVKWRDWWSQEGTATNYVLEDCATGRRLDVRTAETNMHPTRTNFDRTKQALSVIDLHESGARAFATFERIATDLEGIGRAITISTPAIESCACAVLYPDSRGTRVPFTLKE